MQKITLGEFKAKVNRMIEEISTVDNDYTDDPDIKEKFNDITNQVMFELFPYKKSLIHTTEKVTENQEYDLTDEIQDFYQLKKIIGVDYDIDDNIVIFLEDGTAEIYYYKYPKAITSATLNDYKFELPRELIETMAYGVAADLLKSDVSSNYGQVYASRYNERKQMIDSRISEGSIKIEGGLDV